MFYPWGQSGKPAHPFRRKALVLISFILYLVWDQRERAHGINDVVLPPQKLGNFAPVATVQGAVLQVACALSL